MEVPSMVCSQNGALIVRSLVSGDQLVLHPSPSDAAKRGLIAPDELSSNLVNNSKDVQEPVAILSSLINSSNNNNNNNNSDENEDQSSSVSLGSLKVSHASANNNNYDEEGGGGNNLEDGDQFSDAAPHRNRERKARREVTPV